MLLDASAWTAPSSLSALSMHSTIGLITAFGEAPQSANVVGSTKPGQVEGSSPLAQANNRRVLELDTRTPVLDYLSEGVSEAAGVPEDVGGVSEEDGVSSSSLPSARPFLNSF